MLQVSCLTYVFYLADLAPATNIPIWVLYKPARGSNIVWDYQNANNLMTNYLRTEYR
ncbi:MAG: hypothetical protein AVDCRST_MAG95-2678 [uncultured Adhaeribacter sp.]|uniref:Uncharacterized protein n=1 Tax=uncultured Adhaeribacter sp. TaxID=448109 RepID=A0A6J4J313_9BACT|nr:MAG: hypothetical protein AVDCRST_MAG95-2678 [uncultured Adhaeribacter sp.]